MSQPTNAKLFRKKFYQKGNSDNKTKAQSAMEYLMTYGWAILIIAVILAALDFLGVFNTGTFIGPSCLATPGYLCSNPVMTANANGPNLLLFNFKQDSGETLYNVSFACAASSTSQGYPNVNVNSGFNTSSNLTVLTSGSSVTVSGLECYSSNGNLFKDNPIGTIFSGTLWIRYNLQGYPSSEYQYAKIAKITAKVESEAAISAMQSSPTRLTFSSLSPSSPSIDAGKSITLTVSWLGGVSPFTANWLSGASAGSMSLLSSQTGIVSSSLSDSLSVAPTSNTYYSANVIDSSTPPNVVSSPIDLVTVNPALSALSISASSTALVSGQSVTFSSSWTGGTAQYTAKLYSSSTLPCTSLSSLVQIETTSSNSISFPAITPTQTAYYCIYVNDSSYHSSETENSITQEVTDLPPSFNAVTNTISVGSSPYQIAFAPSGAFAYVTNYGSATVSVINTATNSVTATIQVGSGPTGIAFAPSGAFAYVANGGSATVSVINTATNSVTNSITVGAVPYGIAFAPSGAFAYVTNYDSNTVTVINTATNTVINTITVGSDSLEKSVEIAIAQNGAYTYSPNYNTNTVTVINTATNSVANTISVGTNPWGVAFAPSGAFAYVTNYGANTISVINTTTNTIINTISVETGPQGVAFAPSGAYAYVNTAGSNTVTVINTAINIITNTISVGAGPAGIAIAPSGAFAYVANEGSGTVSVLSAG